MRATSPMGTGANARGLGDESDQLYMDWGGRERPALYGLGDDNDTLYGGLTGRGRRALWGLRDNNGQLYEDWGWGDQLYTDWGRQRPTLWRLRGGERADLYGLIDGSRHCCANRDRGGQRQLYGDWATMVTSPLATGGKSEKLYRNQRC
jgi:hypothetical protein